VSSDTPEVERELDDSIPTAVSQSLESTLEKVVDSALQQIVQLACAAIENCSMAGVTLLDQAGPHTVAATCDMAQRIDTYQYEAEGGPCLHSYRNQVVNRVDSTETDQRWPEFMRMARSEGIHSILSYPLVVHHDGLGALNLYSEQEAAFDETDERVGQAFATHAAITLTHAQGHWRKEEARRNLEIALTTRGMIDQAKGVLMERTGATADEAFDSLRRASQRSNRKVFDLAQEIVQSTRRDREQT
jgi:transcriptional regulator with GAF, ATPase, and Fis domain